MASERRKRKKFMKRFLKSVVRDLNERAAYYEKEILEMAAIIRASHTERVQDE